MPATLRVRKVVNLVGSYYPQPLSADQALNLAGLSDKADAMAASLSGGVCPGQFCHVFGDPDCAVQPRILDCLRAFHRLVQVSAHHAPAALDDVRSQAAGEPAGGPARARAATPHRGVDGRCLSARVGVGLAGGTRAVRGAALGVFIGYMATGPSTASPILNLIFFPMAFASGLFIPINTMPAIVQQIALPAYHGGMLARVAVGVPSASAQWVHVV